MSNGIRVAAAVALLASSAALADTERLGLSIGVDGDGPFWNPVVSRINVTDVEPKSLAARAGILAGDEIVAIEGQRVKGKHANDLKAYLKFDAGETRTLELKHANGDVYEAKLTKAASPR